MIATDKKSFIFKYLGELSQKLNKSKDELITNGLIVNDFKHNVSITYDDGSYCFYKYAFFVLQNNKYCVFSEHCGYIEFDSILLEKIEEIPLK